MFLFDVSAKEIKEVNDDFDNLSKEDRETVSGLQEQLKKSMREKLRA